MVNVLPSTWKKVKKVGQVNIPGNSVPRDRHMLTHLILPLAPLAFVLLAAKSRPPAQPAEPGQQTTEVRFWQVRQIIDQRCLACHAAQPQNRPSSPHPPG